MDFYCLLLRNETIDFSAYSQEEMQQLLTEFDAWNASMINNDRLIASASLQGDVGKVLRAGNTIADGPYTEVREAVTGVLVVRAASFDQAVEMASGCPFLPRGGSVEVRAAPQVEFEAVAGRIVDEQASARQSTG